MIRNAVTTPASVMNGPERPVFVARIGKPVGLHGGVRAVVLSDAPGRFRAGEALWVMAASPVSVTLEQTAHPLGSEVVLRFKDYGSIEAVRGWRGCYLAVDERDRAALPNDMYYHDELTGMSVETAGRDVVGTVTAVWSAGPYDLLAVEDSTGRTERLLPLIREFVQGIDRRRRLVTIHPPNGWLG